MNFDDRLNKAIQRGQRRGEHVAREAAARTLSEEECKRLHSQYRLQLSEHIESCLERLPHHFPGFLLETVYGDRGWGAAVARDDFKPSEGKRGSTYSRLEITVRPYTSYRVLELAGKGTVQNKEIFSRSVFEPLADLDIDKFLALVDAWVLEYAEHYALQD